MRHSILLGNSLGRTDGGRCRSHVICLFAFAVYVLPETERWSCLCYLQSELYLYGKQKNGTISSFSAILSDEPMEGVVEVE